MDIEKLKKLIAKYQKSMSYYHDSQNAYNETECRDEYISPLLECFGWDVRNIQGKSPQYKEVVVEKYSNSSERPDYTLTLNGVSKMFVEAKKPSVNITVEIEPAMQIRNYGWNANHTFAILTNFENLLIFDVTYQPQEGDSVGSALYRKYYFEQYVDKFQEIADLISRETVYSGRFDEIVETDFQNETRHTAKIDETFLKQINKWRLEIGNYLYQNNKYNDITCLNDTVQDFINQIVFLRICEDRKLPLYMRLYDTVKNKSELQNLLTLVFKEADKRYNARLFSGDNPIFDLRSDIIFGMIESLYYPKTPYMFKIIEPSILGKIYEAFLAESLVINNNGEVCLAKKKEYIYKSVVSTPVDIVRYMIKTTLDPICFGKTPREILNIRIADIACGSGVFLEEAYGYLVDYCVQWYRENEKEHLLELDNGRLKLPFAEKKEILCKCIYGVDIDVHAVEVSKFSLLLKLIEDETEPSVRADKPILPDLHSNIKHGNSLVSDKDIENQEVKTDVLLKIAPFDWGTINGGKKFDVIIGNPPYVKTEDIKRLHTAQEIEVFKNYLSSYRQYDKYYLFIERALELVNECGVVCYIVPNKFLHTESAEKLRIMIRDKIAKIDDFGPEQLFKDKTIYSSIVTICKKDRDRLEYRSLKNVAQLWDETDGTILIDKDRLCAMPWKQKKNGEDNGDKNRGNDGSPWFICASQEYVSILEKVADKIIPLSEIVEVYNGIQTSAERIYKIEGKSIISDDGTYVKFKSADKECVIEKAILKRYFKPTRREQGLIDTYSDICQIGINYNIFPYDQSGEFITRDIMEMRYPYAWQYLLEHKSELLPKSLGGRRDVQPEVSNQDEWYRYGRSQAITSLNNKQKIIAGVNRSKGNPLYLLDDNNYLIASGGTAGYVGISLLPNSKYQLEYIHAWLSHPWTDLYLQMIGSDFEGGFVARGTYTLPMVPFVEIDFSDARQMNIYNEIINSEKRISKINKEMSGRMNKAKQGILQNEKDRMIKRIRELITKIYQQDY